MILFLMVYSGYHIGHLLVKNIIFVRIFTSRFVAYFIYFNCVVDSEMRSNKICLGTRGFKFQLSNVGKSL